MHHAAQASRAHALESSSACLPAVAETETGRSLTRYLGGSPDKNKGVKDAHERFARLGVVAAILRDPAKRER